MNERTEYRVIVKRISGNSRKLINFDNVIRSMPFNPDYMVIKGYTFNSDERDSRLILVQSNLDNGEPFIHFNTCPGGTYNTNIRLPFKKSVEGTHTFDFLSFNNDGNLVPAGPTDGHFWELAISIEFVQSR